MDFYEQVAGLMNVTVEIHRRSRTDELYVVSYDDHRTAIPVLWCARKCGLIENNPTLMIWDAHADARSVERERVVAQDKLRSQDDLNSVYSWANSGLSTDDGSWVTAAFEGGLAGDIVYVYNSSVGSSVSEKPFVDRVEQEHRIYSLSSIRSELEYQGRLVDIAYRERDEPLWDALGWDPRNCVFQKEPRPNLVVDIDLDAFMYQGIHKKYPWTEQMFADEFDYNLSDGCMENVRVFVRALLRATRLVTIAREPEYCGGQDAVGHIYHCLNHYVLSHVVD